MRDRRTGRASLLPSAVRSGSPADRAGLRRGDLIVEIDEREIRGIEDFMAVLSEATPGDRAIVTVERGGRLIELEVVYSGRT